MHDEKSTQTVKTVLKRQYLGHFQPKEEKFEEPKSLSNLKNHECCSAQSTPSFWRDA
jgi:hypothetical protein